MWTKEIWRFRELNDDLPLVSEAGVSIRFIQGLRDKNWIDLAILIDYDTTISQIRQSWYWIVEWRDRLVRYQGTSLHTGKAAFLRQLDSLHQRGVSYAGIAERINRRIEEYLQFYVRCEKEYERLNWKFKAAISTFSRKDMKSWMEDWVGWQKENVPPELMAYESRLRDVRDWLEWCGLSEEESEAFITEALERARKGLRPLPRYYQRFEGPITKDQIRNRLKVWRQKEDRIPKEREQEGMD